MIRPTPKVHNGMRDTHLALFGMKTQTQKVIPSLVIGLSDERHIVQYDSGQSKRTGTPSAIVFGPID